MPALFCVLDVRKKIDGKIDFTIATRKRHYIFTGISLPKFVIDVIIYSIIFLRRKLCRKLKDFSFVVSAVR